MIGLVLKLLSKIGNLLLNKVPEEPEKHVESTNETNREEIKRGWGGRNFIFFVAGIILLWNYVICPVLDCFGIVLFQLPLGEIFNLLALLISG
ncbi:MAG: hypothetical protein K0S95_765 [Pantoea eucrina]|jgi:hypothetical protein|nr:hypothetical protein [Pantoea eucrina]